MTQETMRKTPDLHRPQAKHLGRDPEKFIERPMTKRVLSAALVAAGTGVCGTSIAAAADLSVRKSSGIDQIENVVVIYAENRSF